MTAHFNKLLTKGKNMPTTTSHKQNHSQYHCHYPNEERDCPDAFTLDPKT